MSTEKSKLQESTEKVERLVELVNRMLSEIGVHSHCLYKALILIQSKFDKIRNVPDEKKLEYERIKEVCLSWKQHVDQIERDYQEAQIKVGGSAAVGALGVGVAALGPTVAMGIATAFGVASTGTAISALSGAAATNAALAWLGGGALAAGGGGMAAGNALLALAGPIGWTLAGLGLLSAGILYWNTKSNKERLENIFLKISERDICSYKLAITEINERIRRIISEVEKLNCASVDIVTFGTDYAQMGESQQYALGAYVNLMNSSTQLLVNPILGLQSKITEQDFDYFISVSKILNIREKKELVVYFANLLYNIDLSESDRNLLVKSFKKDKDFLGKNLLQKEDMTLELFKVIDKFWRFVYVRKASKRYTEGERKI